ncbi:hypothetical protein ATK23_1573 [Glutamicibacter mysorens]|uniref:Uncharacterized protein n=2 Tax=Glutamicibacter mysorens TaxID=257984 RepID=A0ABX4MYM3_9MICC|nr:hypothetical protein [Glutamicibacter mysorens]PJJ44342.1 hypothetical protein ATK23_1573 [Glutamicibacter mysorens]
MYLRRGNYWSLAINTNQNMLMALYLRELSGVHPAEAGPNSRLASNIKNRNTIDDSHGQLKQEWSSWWDSLTAVAPASEPEASDALIKRLEDEGYPALARLARAHYGQATVFAQQHAQDFAENSGKYVPHRMDELERILIDHGVEHDMQATRQEIHLIDVPLDEPRAWLTGRATIVASTSLLRDSKAFHGFIQPMVTIIFPGG